MILGKRIAQLIIIRKGKVEPVTERPEPAPPTEENDEEGVEEGAEDESEAGEKLQKDGCHLSV